MLTAINNLILSSENLSNYFHLVRYKLKKNCLDSDRAYSSVNLGCYSCCLVIHYVLFYCNFWHKKLWQQSLVHLFKVNLIEVTLIDVNLSEENLSEVNLNEVNLKNDPGILNCHWWNDNRKQNQFFVWGVEKEFQNCNKPIFFKE